MKPVINSCDAVLAVVNEAHMTRQNHCLIMWAFSLSKKLLLTTIQTGYVNFHKESFERSRHVFEEVMPVILETCGVFSKKYVSMQKSDIITKNQEVTAMVKLRPAQESDAHKEYDMVMCRKDIVL